MSATARFMSLFARGGILGHQIPQNVNSESAAQRSFTARCRAAAGRSAALNLLVAVAAAAGCLSLYAHGINIPARFSLLNGPTGVAVGVAGVALALAAAPRFRSCLLISWLCLWFTTGLAELRSSAITDGIVLGGIIPYSDANNFLREASRLIEGHNLSEWGSRRPLSDTYLAGHLYMAGDHVTLALVLAGAFSAAAIGLAAIEVRKSMGFIAATLWTWLMLVYCRRYLGEMLSEHAGVAFGAMGAALLVRAFAANSSRCLWAGLFILSIALNARAGALIILPALVAAVTWRWCSTGRVRVLILATVSVAAAFAMSFFILKLVGAREGRLMANYHDHMYGIVFGGDWHQAAADIPNYNKMSDAARAAEVDRRILAAVRARPLLIWRGAERNWADFFTRSKAALGPFSFFRHPNTEYVLLALSGIGLLSSFAFCRRLSPLILATGVGILLSVPFVPTPDADRMRAYAATMPLMFLIPAFALVAWRDWIERFAPRMFSSGRSGLRAPIDADSDPSFLIYCTLPYLAFMLLVPLFARFVAPVGPAVTLNEMGQHTELTLDLDRATWIELVRDGHPRGCGPQCVPADAFKGGIFGSFHYFYPKQGQFLESIAHPGIALVCPGSTNTAFLAIDATHMNVNNKGHKVVILGHLHTGDPDYAPSFLENAVVIPGIAP